MALRQHLGHALPERPRRSGADVVAFLCLVLEEPLRLRGVGQRPCLPQRDLRCRVVLLREPLDDVAALVDLAPLDLRGVAEGVAHRPAQRLHPVQDEQVGPVRRKPAIDQVFQQSLHGRGTRSRALGHAENVLVSAGIVPDRPDHHHVSGQVESVHLDRDEIEAGQVRSHPLLEGCLRQPLETPRNAGLGEARSRILRNAASWKTVRSQSVAHGGVLEDYVPTPLDIIAFVQLCPRVTHFQLLRTFTDTLIVA